MSRKFWIVVVIVMSGLMFVGGGVSAEDLDDRTFPVEGAPDDIKSYLLDEYPGFFDMAGNFYIRKIGESGSTDLNTSDYKEEGILYYGDHSIVEDYISVENRFRGGAYQFKGMGNDSMSPVINFDFPDDFSSYGDVAGRVYSENFWVDGNPRPSSYEPGGGFFNNPSALKSLLFSGIDGVSEDQSRRAEEQAREMIDGWLEGVVDKYATNHDYWERVTDQAFKSERSTENEFLNMTPKERRDRLYIIVPPTAFTWGVATTAYECGSDTNYCYDTFSIMPTSITQSVDFEAVELNKDNTHPYYLDVEFSAVNKGPVDVDTSVPVRWSYRIGDSDKTEEIGVYHGLDWSVDKINNGVLGDVLLNPSLEPGTVVYLEAEINPVNEETGERYVKEDEDNTANNVIKTQFIIEEPPTCAVGGYGQEDQYVNRVCDDWEMNENGGWYCENDDWEYTEYDYQLNNVGSAELVDEKTTLTGDWTRTNDHELIEEAPLLEGVRGEVDDFDVTFDKLDRMSEDELEEYRVSKELIQSLEEMDVEGDELKKIIRAGRAMDLKGTIRLDLKLSSFEGHDENVEKRGQFVNGIIDTLETVGLEVSDSGVAKASDGKVKTMARYDEKRDTLNIDGDILKYMGHEGINRKVALDHVKENESTYGNYRSLTVYRDHYVVYVPVETKNEIDGQQDINAGQFNDGSYDTSEGKTKYYTNLNLQDGLYAITFGTVMRMDALDPVEFEGEHYCKLDPQSFYIKGNIYDDVRAEEVEREEGHEEQEDKWDFGN